LFLLSIRIQDKILRKATSLDQILGRASLSFGSRAVGPPRGGHGLGQRIDLYSLFDELLEEVRILSLPG